MHPPPVGTPLTAVGRQCVGLLRSVRRISVDRNDVSTEIFGTTVCGGKCKERASVSDDASHEVRRVLRPTLATPRVDWPGHHAKVRDPQNNSGGVE